MLRVWKLDGDKLSEQSGLDAIDCANDIVWIDMVSPSHEEDTAVESCVGISVPTKEDMQEIEISARLYEENGADYMTMIAVAQMHMDDPLKAPVTFILHKNALVTVRYNELVPFNQYATWAQKKGGVPIGSAHGIMLGIIESFVNRIADSIESFSTEIENISRAIFRPKSTTIRRKTDILQLSIRKVGAQGDMLGMLRESLASLTRVLSHQYVLLGEVNNKGLKQKIGVLNRDVTSLNDHAAFMSGKMNFLLDATLGMINLEQNQIIKIFSIAAVVFLPPTLVASVYGMNFHHMPELDWRIGYPLALGVMLVSAVVPLLYFKKKGWL
jgi:magnesium transporter